MKHIYFINPPNPDNMKGFPDALHALDVWLRLHTDREEVQTHIINLENDQYDEARRRLHALDYSGEVYVGITSTTATYRDAVYVADVIDEFYPDAFVVLGGHHVLGLEDIVLKGHKTIDATVSGEGEKAFLEIVRRGGKNIENIKGVTTRRSLYVVDSSIKGERLRADELDMITADTYQEHDEDQKEVESEQFLRRNMMTGRGCPHKCGFCQEAGEAVVVKSVDTVVKELDYIIQRDKEEGRETRLSIQDNFFANNVARAHAVADALIEYRERTGNHNFTWDIQTRVEQFNDHPALVEKLYRAGCDAAYFGIENFDGKVLHGVKQVNFKPDKEFGIKYLRQAYNAVENCLKYGITPFIDLQVGLPGEDDETIEINVKMLERIGALAKSYDRAKPQVFISLSVTYPNTGFHEQMIASGVPRTIYETFTEYERGNHEYRKTLGGRFAHGNGGIPHSILDRDALCQGDIVLNGEELRKKISYVDRYRAIEGIHVHRFDDAGRKENE